MSGVDHPRQSYTMDNDTLEAILEGNMDDEYYMFTSQVNNNDDNDKMEEAEDENMPAPTSSILDPFDYVYNSILQSTHVLKPEFDCDHYGAKKFQYEMKGFCWRNGKIKLVENDTPTELMRL
ncbi:hypothetical protein E2562_026925 [Oryza meyeriana var. granulata]|uniref:Uncharacterized protein n=1 Tax=Oryza meyeriana var. granulata TaxID=110450 RepID=A0A6G1CT61_9ORYZ|nr:hypothetical protein E2562_026925 [Oryza meyeriana var. granulata]